MAKISWPFQCREQVMFSPLTVFRTWSGLDSFKGVSQRNPLMKPPTQPLTTQLPTQPPTMNPPLTMGAPHWGQCGGIGWNGTKTCQSPWTCQKLNDWRKRVPEPAKSYSC